MITSLFRGRRFRRTCGHCFPSALAPPGHPRGGLTGHKAGLYSRRHRGSTVGVEEYWQEVLCAFPDCLALFMSTRGDEQYCLEHKGNREQARRLRTSLPPKQDCFEFRLAPEVNGVQYHCGPLAEEVYINAGQTHHARDEGELAVLASFVAQGSMIATRIP
jgi:hypothetical protein